jgi:hypothetical protein
VGSSDVAGELTLTGFAAPQVTFDLRSRNADFGELFSFLDAEQPAGDGGTAAADDDEDDPLARLRLKGQLRIDQGSFRTLDFRELEARMTYAEQRLTLDPVTMQLYDGAFEGRIESNLGVEPPTFAVRGKAQEVDVDAFIADNLELGGVLAGRFSGKLETRGAGADFESIVRGLQGSGSVRVDRGQLGRLNVLERLSTVSGLFGESALQSLTGELATDGTEFEVLSGDLQLDGGAMKLENLLFDAPGFDLRGKGLVDLLDATLDGSFRLSFSPEMSAAMRSDDSRAAKLFWNSSTRRVELPLTLSGPFQAPVPGIDFGEVAENLVEREVRDYIGKRLGLGGEEPAEAPPPPDSGATETGTTTPRGGPPDVEHGAIGIEFDEPQWRGSFLARDLQVSGRVQGKGIDHATLTVVDSAGKRLLAIERQENVERHLASASDPSIPSTIAWRQLVDGKRLLRAEYPLTVTMTVFDAEGGFARTSLEVDR